MISQNRCTFAGWLFRKISEELSGEIPSRSRSLLFNTHNGVECHSQDFWSGLGAAQYRIYDMIWCDMPVGSVDLAPQPPIFFQRGICGGISQISLRHYTANNPGMGEDYDTVKPLIQLIYLDGNNLYGCLIFCGQEDFNGWVKKRLISWTLN